MKKERDRPSFAFKRQVFLNGLHAQTELARLFVLKPWIYAHFTFRMGFILSILYAQLDTVKIYVQACKGSRKKIVWKMW